MRGRIPRAAWSAALLGILSGAGCMSPPVEAPGPGSAFAEIELSYEGCSCFEEVRELKLISRRLFGILPEIDEARQILRLRLPAPRSLPLQDLARAVDGTHALTRRLTIEAAMSLQGGQAVIHPTGQVLALTGDPAKDAGESWRRLAATGWRDPSGLRMSVLP